MKKVLLSVAIVMLAVFMISAVSAKVFVGGKVYKNTELSDSNIVEGALVEVTCLHEDVEYMLNATTGADGSYSVLFEQPNNLASVAPIKLCDLYDNVSVYAMHPSYGSNTVNGVVNMDFPQIDVDLGIVNVPLIPEFGMIAGLATIAGALGMFFFVRRK
jgi:hypothetical protein